MNYKKRKKQWQKEINEGKENYEKRMGIEYDYYGEISRRESMKAPVAKKGMSLNKLARFILFLVYIILQLNSCN